MNKETKILAKQFQPKLLNFELPIKPELIDLVEQELSKKAESDESKCFGYFPAMKNNKFIDTALTDSKTFSKALPYIKYADKKLSFNFVRLSLVKQTGDFPYHLDTDTATALTGNIATIADRLVWRLLLNLSSDFPRTLGYINADVTTVKLGTTKGYLHCVDPRISESQKRSIDIPPRTGEGVWGVLFCASRVLHTGKDDEHGHFVAGYGYEART